VIRIGNTKDSYGAAAIALHWIMAALLVALVLLGIYMVQLPDAGFDTLKIRLIVYHKMLGLLALALATLRLAWRVTNVLPRLVEKLPDWQKVLARFVHLSFYALMFALPITGWLMSSAGGFRISLLGLLDLPTFIGQDDYLFQVFITVHKWLGYTLAALIVVHAGAALRHQFLEKDDTLRKMLPAASALRSFRLVGRKQTRPAGPRPSL